MMNKACISYLKGSKEPILFYYIFILKYVIDIRVNSYTIRVIFMKQNSLCAMMSLSFPVGGAHVTIFFIHHYYS
jgi:hypothetical protein